MAEKIKKFRLLCFRPGSRRFDPATGENLARISDLRNNKSAILILPTIGPAEAFEITVGTG
jgi:hypothetical protein